MVFTKTRLDNNGINVKLLTPHLRQPLVVHTLRFSSDFIGK